MSDLKSLVKEKLKRLDIVPDKFASAVDAHQRKVFNEILKLLDTLDRQGDTIILNEANIAKVEVIINKVKDVFFTDEYVKALKTFAGEFDAQAQITREMIKVGFGDVPESELFASVLKATKRSAVELFGESVTDQAFFQPLRNQILTAVTNNAKFTDTIDAIRTITIGNGKADGLIQSHAKTYARTSFAIADRNYTTTIASSLLIEWYSYSGGEIDSTRPFCDEREGNYYHIREIESWGNLDPWKGWMKGTNSQTIFTNLGGWNCRHSLLPVSVFVVPKDVVRAAISQGYYKPNKEVQKWLNAA